MYTRVSDLSEFFLSLQDKSKQRDASKLVASAVSELADILGFDSAWYGWAQLDPSETVIHTNKTLNLPDSYFSTWQKMADQDLLVAQFLEDPSIVPTYDRNGKPQTDGMEFLSDRFGLRKMATAMCIRPARTTSFYLSAYRGSEMAKSWSADEREFLQCAVNNISVAAHNAALLELNSDPDTEKSAFVSRQGNIVVGFADMRERFGHLWSRGDQDHSLRRTTLHHHRYGLQQRQRCSRCLTRGNPWCVERFGADQHTAPRHTTRSSRNTKLREEAQGSM